MTKEEIIEKYCNDVQSDEKCKRTVSWKDTHIREMLLNFFETNLVIPKGINRHPYADVLHQWVEGAEVESTYGFGYGIIPNCNNALTALDYRVKPQEPVYEWQYLIMRNNENKLSKYYTDKEFSENVDTPGSKWIKIEDTKRERK